MFKLENYSLKQRMQMVAILAVILLFVLTGLFWLLGESDMSPSELSTYGLVFTVIASVF